MPELIDRWAVLEIAMSYCPDDDGSCSKAGCDIREMLDEIEALPSIEAELVKRAKWEICSDGYYPYCSNCKNEPQGRAMTLFCPNCGARMDGEIEAEPVKRGRWILVDDVEHFIAVCSECGRAEDSRDIKDMPYCHCGTRMDGD